MHLRFNAHVDGALPVFVKVVEDRFKSTSRALAKASVMSQMLAVDGVETVNSLRR